MSTAAVSSGTTNQYHQYLQTRQGDLQQLGQALQSGNLASAQTEFNNITTLGQSGPFAGGNAFSLSNRQQDFTAIGKALQSGDLAGAQQAFATLKSAFKAGGGVAATPGGSPATPQPVVSSASLGSSSPVGPEVILNLASASASSSSASSSSGSGSSTGGPEIIINLGSATGSASSPEQITINVGSESSSGSEQVSLSVGNQGANQQEVTLNLNANSNDQIVLNLLNGQSSANSGSSATGGATSTGSAASGGISVSA
jgi:cellulose 1,4-beta-cellobiosidase